MKSEGLEFFFSVTQASGMSWARDTEGVFTDSSIPAARGLA